MKYDFDNLANRRNTNSCKYSCKPNELPMWIADMDFKVLPEITKAIIDKANICAYGYVEPSEEYFEAYINWWKEQHKITLKREWLVHSLGCVASLDSILKRFTKNGDQVVLLSPVYNIFFNCIKNNNLLLKECFLKYDSYLYEIDWDQLEKDLKDPKTKILIICNPHNPIGKLFNEKELRRMIELAAKNDVLIISDEIHCDITDPNIEYVPSIKAAPEYANSIITFISPTKAFNLAGIQASMIVVPNPEFKDIIEKGISSDDLGDPNYFSCEATIAAFKNGREWNKQVREYIYKNKCYLGEYLKKEIPELHLIQGNATYLLWIDISKVSKDSAKFCKDLREQTGLWVCPGSSYGTNGNGFIRINVATSLENIKDACERLKRFVK